MFNALGTGGLTGPGRRRTVGGQGVARSGSGINNNNGYADYNNSPAARTTNMNYGAGSGIGGGPGGGLGGGMGGVGAFGAGSIGGKEDPVKSSPSLNKPVDTQSMTSMGNRSAGGGAMAGMTGGGPQTGATGYTEASAPLMTGSSGEPQSEPYAYRAKALYNCEQS
jgi:hypothetical protein